MSQDGFHEISCPHCNGTVLIHPTEVNCRIFRHGVFSATGQPVAPHAPKEECDRLFAQGLILGCGKPFQLVDGTDQTTQKPCLIAVVCGYI